MARVEGWRAEALHGLVAEQVRRAFVESIHRDSMRNVMELRHLGPPTTVDEIAARTHLNRNEVVGRCKRGLSRLQTYLRAERSPTGEWGLTACALASYAELVTGAAPQGDKAHRALYSLDPMAALAVEALGRSPFPCSYDGGRFVPLIDACGYGSAHARPDLPARPLRVNTPEVVEQAVELPSMYFGR